MPSKSSTAPQAHRTTKAITPVMQDFLAYIEQQTGYKADPMSVQLGGLLRGEFQKSEGNQKRIAAQSEAVAKANAERAERTAARAANTDLAPAKAPVKRATKKAESTQP